MEFRKAALTDLENIKAEYHRIMKKLEEDGLPIWDEVFPFDFFEDDIKKGEFYMLTENDTLISAFSLNMQHPGEGALTWMPGCSRAAYFGKFGVNIDYGRKGIGTMMLERAKETARSLGADRLRLFVIDYNTPAIALYEKSGFRRAEGAFFDVIDEELTLRELGYEFIL